MKLAILDDYAGEALRAADWTAVQKRCQVDVFRKAVGPVDRAAEVLSQYDILCSMRERMPFPAALLQRLPRLQLLTITGPRIAGLDLQAARQAGVMVCYTDAQTRGRNGTIELAWGLMLSLARQLPENVARMRTGGWQDGIGTVLDGKILGLVGLGRLGRRMVPIAHAFGMRVLAWSPNLTTEIAEANSTTLVDKSTLFSQSDFVSLHLVLGESTRHIVGLDELNLLKTTAYLVNTARSGLVDRRALYEALTNRTFAGAALDVFDEEPLPDDDGFRSLPNVYLTPHLGYSTAESLSVYYRDTVENVLAFLSGRPIRTLGTA